MSTPERVSPRFGDRASFDLPVGAVGESGFETLTDPVVALEDHRGGRDSELDEPLACAESL